MCYALLTTCRLCTWLLSVTYPRCSHAKAYAIDPPACPYRMKRKYKSSGLCSACKAGPSSSRQEHRKESLSVTPCEVRIKFRDTEVGAVEARDRARTPPEKMEEDPLPGDRETQEEDRREEVSVNREGTKTRTTRAKKRTQQSQIHHPFIPAEDSDGDLYIDEGSASASVSSSPSFGSEEEEKEEEFLLPRKHKSGTRSKPLPKPRHQTCRKRTRSPGVLERIHTSNRPAAVKKGKRGRPPKQKILWPDRIDAGAFEEVVMEREAAKPGGGKARGRPAKLSIAVPRPQVREVVETYFEKAPYGNHVVEKPRLSCYNTGQPVLLEAVVKPGIRNGDSNAGGVGDGYDLARIIALEASRRDKKWR